MKKTNRRVFLKQTGTGMAGLVVMNWKELAVAAPSATPPINPVRPQPMVVPGLHAYTTEQSVMAGKKVSFCVSSTHPYSLSICRLGANANDLDGDITLQEVKQPRPNPQPITPGSFIAVDKGLRSAIHEISLECWVRPIRTDVWSGLISQHDHPHHCGYGMFLNDKGGVTVYLGDGKKFRPEFTHDTPPDLVQAGQWHHIVTTFDGINIVVWINGKKAEAWSFFPVHPPVVSGPSPLRLGALGENGQSAHILDGDLAQPTMYRRALNEAEIQERFSQQALEPARGSDVLACWPLADEKGERVKDISGKGRHGRIINHATWMVGGPAFDPDVPRFSNYDPKDDSSRGHGLRLASDDLYDCGWSTTHEFDIPKDSKPGIYVGRFRYVVEGQEHLYHTTFVVKKNRSRKRAPLLVLCPSNTWRAYNATPFGVNTPELKKVWSTQGTTNSEGDPPAFNFYRPHAQGQGTYQMGTRMPCPAADPYLLYGQETDYSHLVRADRFAHIWLEAAGYDYDVITDLDLHQDPEILKRYPTFLINGHSEYWSAEMYHGVKKHLDKGGNLICLSGNTMFWRVSFNEEGTIMECRKVDAPGEQVPSERRGESWHSHDGLRGGLMRESGYPGWHLTGLETLGWNNQNDPEQFGAYKVDMANHFLFNTPMNVNVENGDAIGEAEDGSMPRANGHEIDVRLTTLRSLQEMETPSGASMPADSTGMVRLANGEINWQKGGSAFDYFLQPVQPSEPQGGEMIYWERPEGGKVFNAGSIGAGWALSEDVRFQKLLGNVLSHFGVTRA